MNCLAIVFITNKLLTLYGIYAIELLKYIRYNKEKNNKPVYNFRTNIKEIFHRTTFYERSRIYIINKIMNALPDEISVSNKQNFAYKNNTSY